MRDRPLQVVAARLGADMIDGFLDELKNSNAALRSVSSDKSAEETVREIFSNLISRFARREERESRRSLPLQPSSRHGIAPTLSGAARSLHVRSACRSSADVRFRAAEFPRLPGPAPMSRRASRPSSTFFLPHQTKPKALL
jgi:hypothetical protein